MADILEQIATYKREDVAQRRTAISMGDLESQIEAVGPARGFMRALIEGKRPQSLSLIAEVKKASPSKGLIREDFDPAFLAQCYQAGGASCLSILTDNPSFQGHESHFQAARSAVTLPCIRKEFLVDAWQVTESRALGADAILVIMAMVDDVLAEDLIDAAHHYGMDALVEVHDADEMERALKLRSKLIGINNRNLRDFSVDLKTTEVLAERVPSDHVLVAESGIFTPFDVQRLAFTGATAMLVGESLMRQVDVTEATKNLLALA
ncbi:indole-3-glycerol phosphate synthase [Asticcacaulis biprosthecium C19]|uniref:Indole-3-glycerol phosphate synthase n=1 Tax=Asticcacaulis biprosthecium C19 TaxID=715226 RepID=F4QQN3_9CAUL|nr:indole-3-glycerol phosphate synthase TrpC [Asticcacaulis biprosthecium]EGF90520.1 indole-3-glycerol phosphate synthase [Asticcacaulis biprosthecium C19]